jgi:cystathionine beta-synthase
MDLLRAYGAEVVVCPTAVAPDHPDSYYSVAARLAAEIPGAFQPDQYHNPENPRAHERTTGPEIWRQTAGRVTHVVAGIGTGGTITGVSRALKARNPAVQIVGADPEGSVYSGGSGRPYLVEGIGEDFWPDTFDPAAVDRTIVVTDRDSFLTARRVTREEGVLIGGSGGTAVWAALHLGAELGPDDVVVVIVPDSGRGYLSKVYNDDWMRENGFLTRFGRAERVGSLVGHRESPEIPPVVSVGADQTVEEAIDLLRHYRISQLPVLRSAPRDGRTDVHDVVGSLQERTLLDHVFRKPEAVKEPVSTVMDPPFALVNIREEVERVFPLLSTGLPAVLVEDGGALAGIVTRADLLEFVARRNGDHPR